MNFIRVIKNQKAQAIFEFIIFMPIMLVLYFLMLTVSGSINGSINQQKATRGYFFHLNRGNSMSPDLKDLDVYAGAGLNSVGMDMAGWMEKEIGSSPLLTCYEMKPFTSSGAKTTCDQRSGRITNFIKPSTVFGLCSSTYILQDGQYVLYNLIGGNISSGCMIRN